MLRASATALLVLTAAGGCGDSSEEPASPGPERGFELRRVSGTVEVDPAAAAPFRLERSTRASDGSRVDASRGAVEVTAALPGGRRQAARLSAGRFSLAARRGGAVTEITLLGRTCDDPERGPVETRRLFGEGEGNFRTRGRFGAAGVRGTRWGVRDRCDGTLIVAREGTVVAEDFARGRTITLRAPASYLARAR